MIYINYFINVVDQLFLHKKSSIINKIYAAGEVSIVYNNQHGWKPDKEYGPKKNKRSTCNICGIHLNYGSLPRHYQA